MFRLQSLKQQRGRLFCAIGIQMIPELLWMIKRRGNPFHIKRKSNAAADVGEFTQVSRFVCIAPLAPSQRRPRQAEKSPINGGGQFVGLVDNFNTDGRALIGWADDQWQAQCFDPIGIRWGFITRLPSGSVYGGHMGHIKARCFHQFFLITLVHTDGTGADARTRIWNVKVFEQALKLAIFPLTAVEGQESKIDQLGQLVQCNGRPHRFHQGLGLLWAVVGEAFAVQLKSMRRGRHKVGGWVKIADGSFVQIRPIQ